MGWNRFDLRISPDHAKGADRSRQCLAAQTGAKAWPTKEVMSTKMSILIQLAQLRDVLHQMEHDLGLEGLNRKERDILLAFYANASRDEAHGFVSSTDRVRAHPTLESVSQPTFHRALRRLLERGLVERHDALPAGVYAIPNGELLASVA